MNDFECLIFCLSEAGLIIPLIGLITITVISLLLFIIKRNFESLLASQSFMTAIISLNLFSMNCHMFSWLWIYLGIILIGTLLIGFVKLHLDLKLDHNTISLPKFLLDLAKQFNVEIKMLDTQKIKAFIYQKKIYLSVGLLEQLDIEEIKAVIAHEKYHLNHSPNKFLSSILALTSLTFRRINDEHLADRYAAKTVGFSNIINALRKLRIKNYEKRARKLYFWDY